MPSDAPVVRGASQRRLRLAAWLTTGATVVGMLALLPLGFIVWFRGGPTPTQAAFALWVGYGVPLASLTTLSLSQSADCYFIALGGGLRMIALSALIAVLLFPEYPDLGPHEWVALAFFAVPAVCSVIGWTLMTPGRLAQVSVAVTFLLAAFGTLAIAVSACHPGITADLPVSARDVRTFRSFDMAGHYVTFGSAKLSDEAFATFVNREGLSEAAARYQVGLETMLAPAWFQVPERAPLWQDAAIDAETTDERRCWYRAWRIEDSVWVSSGCYWL